MTQHTDTRNNSNDPASFNICPNSIIVNQLVQSFEADLTRKAWMLKFEIPGGIAEIIAMKALNDPPTSLGVTLIGSNLLKSAEVHSNAKSSANTAGGAQLVRIAIVSNGEKELRSLTDSVGALAIPADRFHVAIALALYVKTTRRDLLNGKTVSCGPTTLRFDDESGVTKVLTVAPATLAAYSLRNDCDEL